MAEVQGTHRKTLQSKKESFIYIKLGLKDSAMGGLDFPTRDCGLYIQILHILRMSLDESPARRNRGTHQHIEGPVGFGGILNRYLQ
jgi:hypothetical protein